jgi:alpha-glucoside transport system substrate-binding protein
MSAPKSGSILRRPSRGTTVISAALGLSLVLAGCGGSNVAGGGGNPAASGEDCAAFTQYGDLSGTRVTIYTSIVAPEDQPHIDSYRQFEECTGTQIVYEGSKEFEAQLKVRVQAGSPPDIAYVPQPGLLNTLVAQSPGAVKPAPQAVVANVDQYYSETFKSAGSVDGTLYGAPLGSNVKSYVWYSPRAFAEKGYTVPTTWDEMVTLSERIVTDGGKPWCAGIASGDATGWPLTDWLEDVMLRENGPEVYDQWVSHAIPFNDPRVAAALERVGSILKNPDYVNGGLGDVASIATTTFQEGGQPILEGNCYLHRQANFYAANFEGRDISENGELFAFELPPINPAQPQTILVGSEFVAAFSDRPEVQAFQAYLSTPEWANAKAKAGSDLGQSGWISANTGLDPNNLSNPIDRQSAEILLDQNNTFRFDGSDLMPAAVGSASFWRGMTDWITGQSTTETLNFIEQSWPGSS